MSFVETLTQFLPAPTLSEIVYLVAITHVWARGTIFAWLRSGAILCKDLNSPQCRAWRALFDCPLCSGFWIGAIGHAVYLYFPSLVIALGTGSIVGTASLATYGVIRKI